MHIHEDKEKAGVLLKKKGQQRPKDLKCNSMSTGAGLMGITHTTHTCTHTHTLTHTPRWALGQHQPSITVGDHAEIDLWLCFSSGLLGAMTGPSALTLLKKIPHPWPSFPSGLGAAPHESLAAGALLFLLPPCPRFQLSFLKAPLSSFTLCDFPWSRLAQGTWAPLGMTFSIFNIWLSPGAGQGEWLPATNTMETALLTMCVTLERRGSQPGCRHFPAAFARRAGLHPRWKTEPSGNSKGLLN